MKNKLFFTDLDGTILDKNQKISSDDIAALKNIQKKGYYTVAITGRNILSIKKVIKDNYPFDFIVFSNGAGIIETKSNQLLYKKNLPKEKITPIIKLLLKEKLNFFVQLPIPNNHFCYYHKTIESQEFNLRINIYKDYCKELNINNLPQKASQFIIILRQEKEYNFIAKKLSQLRLNIIRATSPLNNISIWLEIFATEVSKGQTAKKLCDILNIPYQNTIALGNDYNDLDLLHFANQSFIVKNANIQHQKFIKIIDNHGSPITYLLKHFLK